MSVRFVLRARLTLLAIVALLATLGGCHTGDAPRNVVLIVVDTLRRDALGCYGNERGATPNMDAIAADGVRFEQALASSGWTLPSVASLLTGCEELRYAGTATGNGDAITERATQCIERLERERIR